MDAKKIDSGKTFTIVAAATVRAGDVIVKEGLHGVAPYSIASGAAGVVEREGKFEMPYSGGAASQGAVAYWDTTSKYITATSGGVAIGKFAEPVTSGGTVCRVILD